MKLSTKEVVLLVIMIFLISGAVYYYYFLTPKLEELEILSLAVSQKEQQIQQLNLKIAGIEEKRQEVQALQELLNTEQEELPIGISHELQLVDVSTIVRDYVNKPTYSFSSGADTRSNYQINQVEVGFSCTYSNLLTVLEGFNESYHKNQIVSSYITYTGNPTSYYVLPEEAEDPEYTDLNVTMILEFFTYYPFGISESIEQQDFETSYVEEKSPFSPVLR